MLRQLRGIVTITIVWALAWLLPGLVLGTYRAFHLDIDVPITLATRLEIVGAFVMVWTVWGAASGLGFALALGLLERGKTVEHLSWHRLLIAGALGGLIPAALFIAIAWLREPFADAFIPILTVLAITAGLGALCAGVILLLVRRGPSHADMGAA